MSFRNKIDVFRMFTKTVMMKMRFVKPDKMYIFEHHLALFLL